MRLRLKICGMKVPANILEVAALKPDYMGFIFYKQSKRYAGGLSAELLMDLPLNIKKTGVFVDEDLAGVAGLATEFGFSAVQLHGAETPEYCLELKQILPQETEIIKAFGVDENFDFAQLKAYEEIVDYFLFDTQTPDHGGSGKVFNWSLLDRYELDKPYFLSGGIGPEHVEDISNIKDKRLYAIDVNSRFELEPGLKQIDKLNDFKNKLPL
ncbi:MAG TPA: phosphoribosylanthranilate isomerase [Pedobacter sp.]|uniref:phosphoribosylanthranilate isomerase n=1 Tax=Pedobacter sp. TaxID=1411316 RepID=UPI002CDC07A9|nr:phosphoribosylanthranilate isomerase [Pedobacter sp.]HMI00932.1 phosphoribosylanthranilate isomerase [Pedobacter sp.]